MKKILCILIAAFLLMAILASCSAENNGDGDDTADTTNSTDATEGTEATDELKKEIQDYVKKRTAPYKYPRIVVFKESLPKTTSGKIIRKQL